MKLNRFLLSITLLSSLAFAACDPEKLPTTTAFSKSVTDLQADTIIGLTPMGQPFGTGRFTFYSLERGEVVPNSDSATNRWDLAFRGTIIVTNSGNMGPGAGGGFLFNGVYDAVKTVPTDSAWRVEVAPTAYALGSGSGRSWYTYNAPQNLINPTPGRILMVRTATGKQAKVEILNYYRGGVTPAATASDADKLSKQRYYTFRYVVSADGKFE